MINTGFSVRRANAEDQDAVLRLVSEMHGHDVRDRLAWLYAANPHGRATSWVAVDDASAEVVGVASVFPRDVLVNGASTPGAVGGDCFVAPKARRNGLATRIHRATRSDLTGLGLEFVYGPALIANLYALLKAGSQEVTTFKRFVRPLSAQFFSERFERAMPRALSAATLGLAARVMGRVTDGIFRLTRPVSSPGYVSEAVDGFASEWDEWHQANKPSFGVFCSRDAAYLDHRYGRARSEKLTPYVIRSAKGLEGMFVLGLAENGGTSTLVDFMTRFDLDSMRKGLRVAARHAQESGCDALQVRSTPHALFSRALAAEGFMERDQEEPWVFPLLIPEEGETRPEVFGGEEWYFLEGDMDGGDGHLRF